MTSYVACQSAVVKYPVSDKKLNRIAVMIAFCLVAGFFSYFKLSSPILQEVSFLALSIPAFLLIRHNFTNIAQANKAFIFSLIYIIPVFISFLINAVGSEEVDIKKIVLLLNLVFSFYIAAIFSSCKDSNFIKSIIINTSLISLPLFLYVMVSQQNAYRWGRWEPFGMQPNWWGMMVLAFAWGVSLVKNPIVRFAGLMGSFLFMVALQSRGAIVALIPVFFFSSGLVFPLTKRKTLWGVFAFLITLSIILLSPAFLQKGIFERIMDYFYNDVFLINDPYRGLNTGLTGRTEGYAMAWEAFLSSPIIGKGFGEYHSVHNGFLLVLAEGGGLAFIGMLTLISIGVWTYFKSRDWIYLGMALSYATVLMTFPRSFNINMTGIIFLIVLMQSITSIKKY